ncbi:hypothetical protein NMY22_g10977 [Coprinellus aureogranulatus]|nr:hypothetical protein NMY22_g10977 [Coprinellus aureogranulatus]
MSSTALPSTSSRGDLEKTAHREKSREVEESKPVSSIDEQDVVVVEWEDTDPEYPLNWSRSKRWYITILVSALVFNATIASSAPSGIIPILAAQYHLSHTVGVLTISLFVVGFCVGPLLWAPLSEQYGRKPVFVGTLAIFVLTQVGNALSRNTASILVFRMLGGIFAAAPVTNSGGVVSDIWDAKTRGKALALYAIMPFTGPAIGPTISGFLNVAGVDWRWLFWILTILGGLSLALVVLTLPETYKPVLLRHKAIRLNAHQNDNTRYIAPIDLAQGSLWEKSSRILLKPFVILIHEPMLMAITAYMSFLYGTIYLLIQAYPTVFTRDHHLNPGVSGLMLLNMPGDWEARAEPSGLRYPADRCYTFDIQYPLMVVGTAERHIQIFNLTNPGTAFKTITSPLKWQTRVVSCFSASQTSGFAVGSVEGRVAIQYVDDKDSGNNFSFKCHRRDAVPNSKDQALVFAVNDISFHPTHGTFSTCGSDGTIHYWDKDARTRLKTFEAAPGPITTTAFNRNGSLFAYGVSYDWSKGHSGMTPGHPNKIMIHLCKEEEVRKRQRK